MRSRRGWMVAVLGAVATMLAIVWIVRGVHGEERGEEAEEERPTARAPKLSRNQRGEVVVQLGREEQERIGLRTEQLRPLVYHEQLTAYGIILDPAPLISIDGELRAAGSSLLASHAEFERLKHLHSQQQNVSLRDLQAAEAKSGGDQARFDSLRQQLADTWGENIASMSAPARVALISALVQRRTAIARVSLPPGQALPQQPSEAEVSILGYQDHQLVTRLISYAPDVDRDLQGQGFLLRLDGRGFPIRPGAAVTAMLSASSDEQRGVVIPAAALVRTAGKAWAYVQTDPTHFARREVGTAQPSGDAWFMSSGFESGERVVVTGAQALLSQELRPQTGTEEEE